jgi:alpha-glucosidase (family GH31 glycosyl hydrolase)
MRWTQFATFSPLMRPHGKAPRDPWYYGDAAVANYKFFAWVRKNLLNYIYCAAVVAHESGIPIMRSMAVAFPDERHLAAVKDQYVFGEDLLIAPVINEHDSRAISFPSGLWTSLWDGKTVSGPANPKTTVPLDQIPVYLRPGAVVPVQLNQELQFGKSMAGSSVTVLVVTPPNGNATVSRLNAQGEPAKVTVHSTARSFGWTLENFPEINYLLVYGTTTASAVRIDGKVSPKKKATRVDLTPASWEADRDGNRLIVHLPSVQAGQHGPTIKIEVDFKS